MIKSACARALRCWIGPSNSGSIRASRAKVRASSRSSFFRLSPIKRTLRACATITSCPNSFTNRLIHGECVPVSSATLLCGIAPNTSLTAFFVVLNFCSTTTSPPSSNTQYQLQRSPRSNPTVNFFCVKILVCLPATVILFVIAGLLFIAPRARCHWELIASRLRPAFSSHLVSSVIYFLARGNLNCWLALSQERFPPPNFWPEPGRSELCRSPQTPPTRSVLCERSCLVMLGSTLALRVQDSTTL